MLVARTIEFDLGHRAGEVVAVRLEPAVGADQGDVKIALPHALDAELRCLRGTCTEILHGIRVDPVELHHRVDDGTPVRLEVERRRADEDRQITIGHELTLNRCARGNTPPS